MFFLLPILWLILEIKYLLFWLYLWQLKDYHTGRFLDHFRTSKGGKLVFSFTNAVKLVLLVFILAFESWFSYLFTILFLVYLAQDILFFKAIFQGTVKRPVRTAKSVLLFLVLFAIIILFLAWNLYLPDSAQIAMFLIFDILTPIIVSFVVLLLQPFSVTARNIILKKAEIRLKKIRLENKIKVIAVTGSYGKTSTKEFLTTILSKKYNVLATKEHQNSEVGIAKCILEDTGRYNIFIAEIGAYNKGKVKEVCSMIKPDIGIVTGVNEQHLALFGSMKNLLSAEGGRELVQALLPNGLLIVNGDNKHCLDLYNKALLEKRIYSVENGKIDSDIWSEEREITKSSISFIAVLKNMEMMHIKANVLGQYSLQNLLSAILTAKELGMTLEEISEACKDIRPKQSGIVLKQGRHGIEIIDSSYSANPDGVLADLDYLSIFSGKKIIVMPSLIELGKKSGEIHEKIGRKIAQICDLAIITTKDYFVDIKKGAVDAGMQPKDILFAENPQDIFSLITLYAKSGDAVLLEGRVPEKLHELL